MTIPPDKSIAPSSLGQVRTKTDTSLKSERSKSDESLVADSLASEKKEDRILATTRSETDKTQMRDRESRDREREESRDSSGPGLSAVEISEDQTVEKERSSADKARFDERSAADTAKLRERRRLRLTAESLLTLERGTTDADLQSERTRTDREIHNTAGAHTHTKAILSTKEEYLAIVSHDLRNPLASISMGAEALMMNLQEDPFDRAGSIEMLAIVQRNVAMMDRLITDLLDVERMGSGKIEVKLKRYSVTEIFGECEDLFQSVADHKTIKLDIVPPKTPIFVRIDHDRILQVLSNLIGNALKYTPRTGLISLVATQEGDQVSFSVKDSGPGIPTDEQLRIFEKFSQLPETNRQGLGLGLYISKWIIEAHGGTLSVNSARGEGATFTFSVPNDIGLRAFS